MHAKDAACDAERGSAVELQLLREVPRRHASTLRTDKFMVFQVQTGMICDPEEDAVLSIPSPCLSLPKHT